MLRPQETPQTPTHLEEEVKACWRYPALSLLSTTSPSPFLQRDKETVTDSNNQDALKLFKEVFRLSPYPSFLWMIWSCFTQDQVRNGSNVTSGNSLGIYNNNKPVKEERQLWRILRFSRAFSFNFHFCSTLLDKLITYYTPVSLVVACLGVLQHSLKIFPASSGSDDSAAPSVCTSFAFAACSKPSCVTLQNLMESTFDPLDSLEGNHNWLKFNNLHKELGSHVQAVFLTAQSVLYESGAQGTMNKDYRLARKGASTGFGHGRRHSCLGYVQ